MLETTLVKLTQINLKWVEMKFAIACGLAAGFLTDSVEFKEVSWVV